MAKVDEYRFNMKKDMINFISEPRSKKKHNLKLNKL